MVIKTKSFFTIVHHKLEKLDVIFAISVGIISYVSLFKKQCKIFLTLKGIKKKVTR